MRAEQRWESARCTRVLRARFAARLPFHSFSFLCERLQDFERLGAFATRDFPECGNGLLFQVRTLKAPICQRGTDFGCAP
jgi:hypothetical protein